MARRWPFLSRAALVVLLLTEIVALTLRYDGATLGDRPVMVAALIDRVPLLVSLGMSVVILVGVAQSASSPDGRGSRPPAAASGRGHRLWPYLLGHLVAFGGLAWLTGWIFEGSPSSSSPLGAALWLATGLATVVLWMLAALPSDQWVRLVRNQWKTVLLAIGGAVAAVALGQWTSSLWGLLHDSTFWSVRRVLGLFYGTIICRPDRFIVGTPRFEAEISHQCSGFEGIGLIWSFLGVCFWCFRRELRFPQAFLLLPIGTALSWAGNVLRIAALIALGDGGWEAMAVGGFHSQAGWLAFNGIALGLVAVARRAPLFSRVAEAARDRTAPDADPTAAYVAPLLAIALGAMLTGALSPDGFDRLYLVRVLAAVGVLWHYRRGYNAMRRAPSWQALAVGAAVYGIWTALEPRASGVEAATAIGDGLARMPRAWAAAWLVARAVGSIVVVPLAEELAFRGYLTRRLIDRDFLAVPEGRFTWPSFLVSSILFGLLHQRRLAGTIAGMAYALAYSRRGRLADAVMAHATTNLLITTSVLATGEWWRWS